ncbi:unnamed protein product [Schistosoma curassoni]|uniref:Uncharacterized protein n=1 Tax=Schistosoma curassoni TaxID=6186 RepID=A0A183JQ84_9TREM|nr:unnamed protein product [Schistosoma curassoni]
MHQMLEEYYSVSVCYTNWRVDDLVGICSDTTVKHWFWSSYVTMLGCNSASS